jgi:hypothetical protein
MEVTGLCRKWRMRTGRIVFCMGYTTGPCQHGKKLMYTCQEPVLIN